MYILTAAQKKNMNNGRHKAMIATNPGRIDADPVPGP
jgi:hypothetical protein